MVPDVGQLITAPGTQLDTRTDEYIAHPDNYTLFTLTGSPAKGIEGKYK